MADTLATQHYLNQHIPYFFILTKWHEIKTFNNGCHNINIFCFEKVIYNFLEKFQDNQIILQSKNNILLV